MALAWQPALLDLEANPEPARRWLDATSWVDHLPGYLDGHDDLFQRLTSGCRWEQRTRVVYEKLRVEPRLTWFPAADEAWPDPLPAVVADLSARYGVEFDQVGANLYRDGRDSVAWHRDRVHRVLTNPLVATISLGSARPFLLRPYGSHGHSVRFVPQPGDLLVMGGACQHDWQHTVPKIASAPGPRLSVSIRHGAAAREVVDTAG